MKLLNFANLKFVWEEEKEILFYLYCVRADFEFEYWFYYPASFYFRINTDITRWKNYYRYNFINKFKKLKKDIANETSELQ